LDTHSYILRETEIKALRKAECYFWLHHIS